MVWVQPQRSDAEPLRLRVTAGPWRFAVAAPVRSPASKAGEPGSCAGDASLYASASGAAAMWSPGGATLPLLRFQARLRRTAGIFAVLAPVRVPCSAGPGGLLRLRSILLLDIPSGDLVL